MSSLPESIKICAKSAQFYQRRRKGLFPLLMEQRLAKNSQPRLVERATGDLVSRNATGIRRRAKATEGGGGGDIVERSPRFSVVSARRATRVSQREGDKERRPGATARTRATIFISRVTPCTWQGLETRGFCGTTRPSYIIV